MSTHILNIATDPDYNIWVNANAGAGKTYVLSQRVIRLLAKKISPSKILCLTYTKAAASEMKIRVFERLESWVHLNDEALKQELIELDSNLINVEDLKYARQLFAKVQDTPGGLKIQTIHSLCELLLHNFCLEADIPKHFTLLDDNTKILLLEESLLHLMEDNNAKEDLEDLLSLISKNAFEKAFEYIAQHSNKFEEYIKKASYKLFAQNLSNASLIEVNMIIYRLAAIFLNYFNNIKNIYGYLTFDDLIYKTRNLLYKDNFASWVHYKLDQGIDHVLVDEAQDTNPMQWEIIQALTLEFFAGDGQKENERSIFAVGDEKQSIYSFQGADAVDFATNGAIVEKKARMAEKNYKKLDLIHSYRSSAKILEAVDKIFEKKLQTKHIAKKTEIEDSYVEVWPDVLGKTIDEASLILAKKITQKIATLIKIENRQPKDIFILVEQRTGNFCSDVLYELKKNNIPVAGLDKLKLYNHIAIRDLCSLGRFALHPYDDLALANIFKSPILGLSEEDLYNAASNREGSLWNALQVNDQYKNEVNILKKYCNLANLVSPFEFYSTVLSEDKGRKKFLARLGSEANDVLNEFLALCLKATDKNNFSLHSFLAKIEKGDIEIKREATDNNEVRIMTIHGAKGLEAEIVFLVSKDGKELNKTPAFIENTASIPFFIPTKDDIPESFELTLQQQKKANREEKNRLLYVAITRAKSKIFACYYGSKKAKPDSWQSEIRTALGLNDSKIRYGDKLECKTKIINEQPIKQADLPICLFQQAQKYIPLPKPLVPSGSKVAFIEQEPNKNFLKLKRPEATIRHLGIVKHKLLQYLPDIAVAERLETAQNIVNSFKPSLSEQQKKEALDNVFNFLNTTQYKTLFSKDSRAEISIVGDIKLNDKTYKVSGQIDRLIQEEDKIIFCDYKTGSSPNSLNDIPMEHLIQMALYYKLIYNYNKHKKQIIALLIYTKTFKSFELDITKMDNILTKYIKTKESS